MLELGVLADDLTGGMMIAAMLEGAGARCPLVTSVEGLADLPADAEAVVLARKIRLVAPDLARQEAASAAAAFRRLGVRRIYQKYSAIFASTERGNIGPIAETLLEATGAARTIFCPAYVERDVTVFQGRMFLGRTPLADSPARFDAATPMLNSNLVEVLQAQTTEQVGLLTHKQLTWGKGASEAALRRQADARFFIVDAVDAADVDRIAALTLDWPLITGGDSLPPALARAWKGEGAKVAAGRRLLSPAPGLEAVIAGSCAAPTLEQLAAFEKRHPLWRIDLARDGDDADLARRIVAWAAERLGAGPVAVATSQDQAGVGAAHARFGRDGAARRADRLLADVARGLFEHGVRKFVVAGGETAGEVLAALGVRQVEVGAYDELFGGYCHQRTPQALALVLKAGGIGDADFLLKALERMREADQAEAG